MVNLEKVMWPLFAHVITEEEAAHSKWVHSMHHSVLELVSSWNEWWHSLQSPGENSDAKEDFSTEEKKKHLECYILVLYMFHVIYLMKEGGGRE